MQSCCKQDYRKIEIIVRDDGSPNFEKKMIENIFLKYDDHISFKIIHDNINHGTVVNFNEAIKQASGEYIVVVSGDDYLIDTHAVTSIVNMFDKDKTCMCITAREQHVWLDGRKVILPSPYEEFAIKHFSCNKLWYLISAHPCFIVGSATSYRRKVFDMMGFFDNSYKLLEDWPFYLKLFEENIRIKFLSYETICHSSGGVSTATGMSRNRLLVSDDLTCINYAINKAEKMRLSKWQKNALHYRRQILENELLEKNNSAMKTRYFIFSLANYLWEKLRNLSLRGDVRRVFNKNKR